MKKKDLKRRIESLEDANRRLGEIYASVDRERDLYWKALVREVPWLKLEGLGLAARSNDPQPYFFRKVPPDDFLN